MKGKRGLSTKILLLVITLFSSPVTVQGADETIALDLRDVLDFMHKR